MTPPEAGEYKKDQAGREVDRERHPRAPSAVRISAQADDRGKNCQLD
jgi:hypothetical protein